MTDGLHRKIQLACDARVREILRQQRVMFAVMDKASQLNVLSDPRNVVNLWDRYKSTISTDRAMLG